ncbi:hypothetical protein niasHT_002549 [Heterodera trifolii]|uniref:Uncharacterized protein n=1 Tax=Heterodera trifolii TaxID=157864 RepID=A0ABD2MBA5_9BILA
MSICNAPYVDNNIFSLTNVLKICEFMQKHLYLQGTDDVDIVKVYANTFLKQIWRNEVNPYGPGDDDNIGPSCCDKFTDCLQKSCFPLLYSNTLNRKVNFCLTNLVQHAQQVGTNVIILLQIEKRHLKDLQNMIRNGRQFASRIIYYPLYELEKEFYEWLITSAESVTSYSMIEDIGIATVTLGPWDKDILEMFLQEHFFNKLIFDTQKGVPYWQMNMKFPPSQQRKVVVQLCQWSEFSGNGQKLRMKLKKIEEETLISRVDGVINDNLDLIRGKDVCF